MSQPYNIDMNAQESLYISFERERLLRSYMPSNEQAEALAAFFAVCADPTRVKILSALALGDMCVGDIAQLLNMTPSAISHQLRALRQSRLIKYRREGKTVFYSLADGHVRAIINQGMEHIRE